MEGSISLLLYICFVVMGMRILRNSLQSLFSSQIHRGFLESSGAFWTGTLGSLFLLSSSVYNRIVLNLVSGRLVSSDRANGLALGSLIGSFLMGLLFLHSHLLIAVPFLLFGTLGLVWSSKTKAITMSRVLFGLGLVYWGLSLSQGTTDALNLNMWAGLGLGLLLSLLLRSGIVALIIGLWTLHYGASVTPFMYGAGVLMGGALPEFLTGKRGGAESFHVALLSLTQRMSGAGLGILFAFWLSTKEGNLSKVDALLFYGFMVGMGTLITWILKNKLLNLFKGMYPGEEYPEEPHLDVENIGEDTTPAIALIQARRQVGKMANIVGREFIKVREYLDQENSPKALAKIKDYERVTDNMKEEMESFLLVVMEKPLTDEETGEVRLLLRLISDLESIADYLDKVATYRTRMEESQKIPEDLKNEFFDLYDQVEIYYRKVIETLGDREEGVRKVLDRQSSLLKDKLEKMRQDHVERLDRGDAPAAVAMTYSDMVVALRKIRGHTRHISNALGL